MTHNLRWTTDDGRQTTPGVWHKLHRCELKIGPGMKSEWILTEFHILLQRISLHESKIPRKLGICTI